MADLTSNNADPGSQASSGSPPSAGNSQVIPNLPAPSAFLSTVPEEATSLKSKDCKPQVSNKTDIARKIEEEVDRLMPPDLNIDLSLRTPAKIEKPPRTSCGCVLLTTLMVRGCESTEVRKVVKSDGRFKYWKLHTISVVEVINTYIIQEFCYITAIVKDSDGEGQRRRRR